MYDNNTFLRIRRNVSVVFLNVSSSILANEIQNNSKNLEKKNKNKIIYTSCKIYFSCSFE